MAYPLSLPSTALQTLTITPRRSIAMTASPFNMSQQVYDWGGHCWTARFSTATMNYDGARLWRAFLAELRGSYGTFLLGPSNAAPSGTATGGTLETAGVAGDTALDVQGAGNTLTFKAGDWLQIGTGATAGLYELIADATSDSSGDVTLTIEPALKAAYAISTAITLVAPKGVFRLSSPDQGPSHVMPGRWQFHLDAIEAL